ncbi:hypothetical protein ACOSP7_021027 [Xanthoceras sorbifolium]
MVFSSMVFDGLLSPEIAEAMAILHGVQLALDIRFSPICIEPDTASIVQLISSRTNSFSDVGLVVDDILLLLGHLPVFSVFTGRRNKVAYGLAKLALGLISDSVWVDDYLSCVASLVSDDIQDSL